MVAINENKLPGTLMAAIRHFTPEKAAEYVASIKWPSGPCCPKCGSVNVGTIASRAKFQCREKQCRKQFSVTTGTIMEASHLRLEQWVVAVWMIANCRNGISSCEIARHLGCKQQSAWHLLHRVRHLFTPAHEGRMTGIVQCDETFVGGIVKFMHAAKRRKAHSTWGVQDKAVVFGMLERGTGQVRAHTVPSASRVHVQPSIEGNVEGGAELHTDSAAIYRWTSERYNHRTVNHQIGEYVSKDGVSTNALEGFFNCLRRGLKGTYIKPTPMHLSKYVDEQVWRFNVRHLTEWERFEQAMSLIVGKRLAYTDLTNGAKR